MRSCLRGGADGGALRVVRKRRGCRGERKRKGREEKRKGPRDLQKREKDLDARWKGLFAKNRK